MTGQGAFSRGGRAPETGLIGRMSLSRCASFLAAASASRALCASTSSGVSSSGSPSLRRRSLRSSSAGKPGRVVC